MFDVFALRDRVVEPTARKILSFTDNRQDASLQAGHLNDFVQVALLRGALVRAVEREGSLSFDRLGPAVFESLGLAPEQFMKEARSAGPGVATAKQTMVDLLEYRGFEDLRRAWRVAQPNLEQCGLLRIDYDGLAELAEDEAAWAGAPVIAAATPERRKDVLRAALDHLRGLLAIDAACLKGDRIRSLTQRANQWLCEPWAIDEQERLRRGVIALLPGVTAGNHEEAPTVGLGYRSAVGRYLRSRHTWGLDHDLSADEVEDPVERIVGALRGHILAVERRQGEDYGVQMIAGSLRWRPGDGRAPGPDPVRARSLYLRRPERLRTEPNRYFERLYRERAIGLIGIVGREHTGQVAVDDRIEREQAFREGKLPALFCSPTMELGVDIRDLAAVHLRNVPPTPANYAQRSGRAGRGGRPALVVAFCSQGNAHDQYFMRRKERMIGGSIAPARMDLANQELVEAHLHSVWLSIVGLGLGRSMVDLLDMEAQSYPLLPEKAVQLQLSDQRQREVAEAIREVVASCGPAIAEAEWYSDAWLEETVRLAPAAFDQGFERWRQLYQAATQQRDAARRRVDAPRLRREEREEAEQREREAKREINLLLNQVGIGESDFYPYRYLATEGFLPGYNFPRLPLRALVASRDSAQSIDRPRFLGLSEFGPHNVIYHEGRKHRVVSCVLPAGGIDQRITRARICLTCGYIHPREAVLVDLCEHCGTQLDDANASFPQALFDQPTVRASRWTRISSDEEERAREGYHVMTHYRFAPGSTGRRAEVRAEGAAPLLEVLSAPQAELWRVNHGWRRAADRDGFTIDRESGRWRKREDDEADGEGADPAVRAPLSGVRPYVTDSRNLLLLRPAWAAPTEPFLKTLVYAIQRGIQFAYQVEEQEVAVELIGQGQHQRLLLWEAAEGGTGVWDRIVVDPQSVAKIAAEALRVCHFDPQTGADDPAWSGGCAAACYDCLLSYSNQRGHRHLNRHLVKGYLLRLARAELRPIVAERNYDEQYRWLRERTDPASDFERTFLDHLHDRRLRLPNFAQRQADPEVAAQADFYYERDGLPGICVFVDGPAHDQPAQAGHDREVREGLRDRGYRVIAIRYGRSLAEQVAEYAEVFGQLPPG